MRYTQVNPYILVADWQLLRFRYLTREGHIPLVHLTLNRDRLYLPLDGPMQFDLDVPHFGEMERLPLEFPPCPIRVGKAIIAVPALEAREARLFPILATSEEVLKCLV